jgi:phosphopentomutase
LEDRHWRRLRRPGTTDHRQLWADAAGIGGKDTTTGHWEIAGVLLDKPFPTFTRFPDELIKAIQRESGVEFLGNYARSGTAVIEELGSEHLRTGRPILYTSADSVLQIAAHQQVIRARDLTKSVGLPGDMPTHGESVVLSHAHSKVSR